jgi:hypothetical protein
MAPSSSRIMLHKFDVLVLRVCLYMHALEGATYLHAVSKPELMVPGSDGAFVGRGT